jgi:hypothetical protein
MSVGALRKLDVWVIPGVLLAILAFVILIGGASPYGPIAGAIAIRLLAHGALQRAIDQRNQG